VFVEDGSADDSFEVLAAGAQDGRVRVLGLSRNFGSNAAILAGLAEARGDAVMDAASQSLASSGCFSPTSEGS
jgi:glycosyltransferase involved in cell wall biosynthesis